MSPLMSHTHLPHPLPRSPSHVFPSRFLHHMLCYHVHIMYHCVPFCLLSESRRFHGRASPHKLMSPIHPHAPVSPSGAFISPSSESSGVSSRKSSMDNLLTLDGWYYHDLCAPFFINMNHYIFLNL